MKPLFLILLCAASLQFGFAQSQKRDTNKSESVSKQSPEEHARKQAAHAQIELNLNTTQTEQYEKTALVHIKENSKIHEQHKGSTTPEERKTMRQQLLANNETFKQNVMAFLNSEQQIVFKHLQNKRKTKTKKHKN